VSFVSDEKIREVLDLHSFEDRPMVAARLDVRRNSTFDVAAATAPVTALDEHFRCAPHLVDFVADEIYSHSFTVATRAPSTESRDCVTHVRLEGSRDRDGIVRTEVDWTISELQRLRQTGVRSIGVVTPFRAQADALEAAVLGQFTLADLEAMDLRVGTVHAFQGNERDRIIVNLGIGPDEGVGTWRFADDPHVLAVILTRARRHMTILTSSELPHQSRLASYVAAADSPPGPVPSAGQSSEWVQWIDDALRTAGCATTTAYPTGRHRVDICVRGIGDGPADDMPHMDTALTDIAIEAEIDPGGPADHIDRHLALARSGWSIIEAHRSKWDDRKGELVVELLARLRASDPSRPRC
jgi:hypothetical protein